MRLPFLILCFIASPAACGKKGSLETPVSQTEKSVQESGADKAQDSPQDKKSERKFILDPLLF